MKRYGYLFEKICSEENLLQAHLNARRGKRSRTEVIKVEKDLEHHIQLLKWMLETESYEVSEYTMFKKKDKGKVREIYKLPYFPDRIIQWAILQVISTYFDKHFILDTYSSIKGRGIHFGVQRVKQGLKDAENTTYCLKMDVKKYYPSIDKEILKEKLARRFKDEKLLRLLFKIIDSNENGVPIGNYLSQYFANYYLSDFDHWMKERHKEKHYYRYMDDVCILHKSKKRLHYLKEETEWYWKNKLNLTLKSNWQIFPVIKRGVDFLGYKFFHSYTKLRKSIKETMKKKVSERNSASYLGWLNWCNCNQLKTHYLEV